MISDNSYINNSKERRKQLIRHITRQNDAAKILHSDIQGAEVGLVRTCSESIRQQKIDYYFISTHSDPIHQDCLHYLKSQGLLIVAKRRGALGPDQVAISKNGTTCPIYSSK